MRFRMNLVYMALGAGCAVLGMAFASVVPLFATSDTKNGVFENIACKRLMIHDGGRPIAAIVPRDDDASESGWKGAALYLFGEDGAAGVSITESGLTASKLGHDLIRLVVGENNNGVLVLKDPNNRMVVADKIGGEYHFTVGEKDAGSCTLTTDDGNGLLMISDAMNNPVFARGAGSHGE